MTWQSVSNISYFKNAYDCLSIFICTNEKNHSDATKPAFTPGKLPLWAECQVWPKTKWTNKKFRNLRQAPNKIWSMIRLAVTSDVQSLHITPSVKATVMLPLFIFVAFWVCQYSNHHLIILPTDTELRIAAVSLEGACQAMPVFCLVSLSML